MAVAPAGLRERPALKVLRIGVLAEGGDDAGAMLTSATALGAGVAEAGDPVDLLVVGSSAGATLGRVTLSAAAEYEIETSSIPVLVVPRGVAVSFPEPALARRALGSRVRTSAPRKHQAHALGEGDRASSSSPSTSSAGRPSLRSSAAAVRRVSGPRRRAHQGAHRKADVEQPRIRRGMAVEDDQRSRDVLACVLARQQAA